LKESKPEHIRNKERAKQQVVYMGMPCGLTDIDGMIEWKGKGYFLVEVKYKDMEINNGQRLAFERLTEDIKKPCIFVIAEHSVDNPEEDIILDKCKVRKICREGNWKDVKHEMLVGGLAGRFINKLENENN